MDFIINTVIGGGYEISFNNGKTFETFSKLLIQEKKASSYNWAQVLNNDFVEIFQFSELNFQRALIDGVTFLDFNSTVNKLSDLFSDNLATSQFFYTHRQQEPASTWQVYHNLGRRPNLTIIDENGGNWLTVVNYIDSNSLEISFNSHILLSGFAHLT